MLKKSVGLNLMTEVAFAGVGYMEQVAKSSGSGRAALFELSDTAQGVVQPKVESLFNKFTIFQYSGLFAGQSYQLDGHFIGNQKALKSANDYVEASNAISIAISSKVLAAADRANKDKPLKDYETIRTDLMNRLDAEQMESADAAKRFINNARSVVSNPTAAAIIKWGAEVSPGTVLGYQPYSHTDFMYCKYYGKIPNNRLVTLRRYPYPISDSLKLSRDDSTRNAIPTAQAVTWFGSDTGNDLNKMGIFSWDMPWAPIEVQEQEITGNEVTVSDLLSSLEGLGPKGTAIKGLLESAYAATSEQSNTRLQELTGYDKKIQDYQKTLYSTGPYWNRIYGPVNVIHKSSRRSRGMQEAGWLQTIKINFSYKFRSFGGLSPKIAALDLISNFVNLTYNDAQFLGQLARYYPKTGLKFSPTVTEALGNILTNWGTTYSGDNTEAYIDILANMFDALDLGSKALLQNPGKTLLETGKNIAQTEVMSRLKNAIPDLISIKSALSDRPVGEWHLVVGNPMNPIFVMGDLLCTNVDMIWDQELGPDDFPTGVTFTVTLKQGKPRDKTAIERMLNLGQTKLTSGAIRGSSTDDTFGESNNKLWNDIYTAKGAAELKQKESDLYAEAAKSLTSGKGLGDSKANEALKYHSFKSRVLRGYGAGNGDGGIVDNANLDSSLLLMYYARQYGRN